MLRIPFDAAQRCRCFGTADHHWRDRVLVTSRSLRAMFRSIRVAHAGRATRYERGGYDMRGRSRDIATAVAGSLPRRAVMRGVAVVHDVGQATKHRVGEPVAAQIVPNPLDRIELRAVGGSANKVILPGTTRPWLLCQPAPP